MLFEFRNYSHFRSMHILTPFLFQVLSILVQNLNTVSQLLRNTRIRHGMNSNQCAPCNSTFRVIKPKPAVTLRRHEIFFSWKLAFYSFERLNPALLNLRSRCSPVTRLFSMCLAREKRHQIKGWNVAAQHQEVVITKLARPFRLVHL